MYRDWRLPTAPGVEVWAVQPPGREKRWSEPPVRRLGPFVDAVAAELSRLTDRPYALFGHSMGALAAFEVARALRRAGLDQPRHLFLSAHRSADLPARREPMSPLPAAPFAARLAAMAGPLRQSVQDAELLALMEPTLRADFEVCETYRYRPERPLDTALTCLVADDDPEVDVDEVADWWRHSTGAFDLHTFTGGHLFIRDHTSEVLAVIGSALAVRRVS